MIWTPEPDPHGIRPRAVYGSPPWCATERGFIVRAHETQHGMRWEVGAYDREPVAGRVRSSASVWCLLDPVTLTPDDRINRIAADVLDVSAMDLGAPDAPLLPWKLKDQSWRKPGSWVLPEWETTVGAFRVSAHLNRDDGTAWTVHVSHLRSQAGANCPWYGIVALSHDEPQKTPDAGIERIAHALIALFLRIDLTLVWGPS